MNAPMHSRAISPVVAVSDAPMPGTGRICASCGADLTARRANVKFCSGRCQKRSERGMPPAGPRKASHSVPLAHPSYSIERCPRCDFPEADGGACANCGWTLPRPGTRGGWTLHPAGTIHGPAVA
jgi:hypothetical protein